MTEAALEVRDLAFAYRGGGGRGWELRVKALGLARGEQLLLTARSGGGKSTLLHLIAGLREPHEGHVVVAGQDVHALRGAGRDHFRGRTIGMIFQTFNLLWGFSALENVAAALHFAGELTREKQAGAVGLLERLGIEHPRAKVEELSIGQQQRVAVARALVCDPVLVLADEPTASLDPENAHGAMDLIQQLCREKNAALLCVSHDPAMSERLSQRRRLEDLDGGGRGEQVGR